MPYQHSCFISYKHPPSFPDMPRFKSHWLEFVQALAEGVARFSPAPLWPYYDAQLRRTPGIAYPQELSLKLCHSVCLIAVLQPEYLESRWCLAEWKTMERLESVRVNGKQDLIIPVFFRGDKHECEKFANGRQVINLSQVVSPRQLDNIRYRMILEDIARRIMDVRSRLPEPDCSDVEILGPEEKLLPLAPDPSPFSRAVA